MKKKVTNRRDLQGLITRMIHRYGPEVDLNFIDTSEVTSMAGLFCHTKFNGKIDQWNR
jgi:phosphosulfolactate synthase (CoM biosynthesis protein A)